MDIDGYLDLTKKNQTSYEDILQTINDFRPGKFHPRIVMSDFDQVFLNAVAIKHPSAEQKGLFFFTYHKIF